MKFDARIDVPLKMNCNNFGDPLTSHVVPSSGQNTLFYDQTPAC